ncbi:MAG: hypothetical protein AAF654_14785 [Myxococcota bacterium]
MKLNRSSTLALSLCVFAACSDTDVETGAEPIRSTAVEDIKLLSVRADGRFDVVCQNGDLEVRTAEEIRDNRVCESSSGGVRGLICAARDGDRLPPWVVATIGAGGVTRFQNVQFSRLGDCRNAIASAVARSSDVYVCGSRDRDGVNPWSLYHLDWRATRLPEVVYRTVTECIDGLHTAVSDRESVTVCASRDRDGIAPWQQFALDGPDAVALGPVYQQLSACVDNLGSGGSPDGRLMCIARDNDGLNPWIIAERLGISVTRFGHAVYREKSSCEAAIEDTRQLGSTRWTCATRDRDGVSPFALVSLTSNASTTALVYREMDQCEAALERAVESFDGTLVCSSRDRDGLNPWNIYALSETQGIIRTDLSYRSLDECLGDL